MTSSEKTVNVNQADPIPLDPVILLARDELLEKYSDKSYEEQITFYKAVVEGEKDSVTRLSAMAARVYILRKRLAMLAGNLMEDQLDDLSTKQEGFDLDRSLNEASDTQEPERLGNDKSWMRLRIKDSSEVNGVRFPAGVVIDVKREDGEKLIESGKADFISTEESRYFKSEEGLEELDDVKDKSSETEDIKEKANDAEALAESEVITEETTGAEVLAESEVITEETTGAEVLAESEVITEETTGAEVLAEPEVVTEETTEAEVLAEPEVVTEEATGAEVLAEPEVVTEEATGAEVLAEPEVVTEEITEKGSEK